MFTTFLLTLSLATAAVLVALLAANWHPISPAAMRANLPSLTVAALTAALVALGFLVT